MDEYEVGLARAEDPRHLPAIERRAGEKFLLVPSTASLPPYPTSTAYFERAYASGLLWTARVCHGPVVGFAVVEWLGGVPHLEELDVLPEHGRRGLGTALVRAVCDWAMTRGEPAVTLCAFRDVPWNAPFYERLGFRCLAADELTEALRERVREEARRGLPPELRVVMRYTGSSTP